MGGKLRAGHPGKRSFPAYRCTSFPMCGKCGELYEKGQVRAVRAGPLRERRGLTGASPVRPCCRPPEGVSRFRRSRAAREGQPYGLFSAGTGKLQLAPCILPELFPGCAERGREHSTLKTVPPEGRRRTPTGGRPAKGNPFGRPPEDAVGEPLRAAS